MTEMIVETGIKVVEKLFEHNRKHTMDDAEFAPLVGCAVEAVESQLLSKGVSHDTAANARKRVEESGVQKYVQWCAENDPEGGDAAEDATLFRYLMIHGAWPR